MSPSVYGCVYVVTNTVNGKQYVGQTVKKVSRRWSEHLGWARAEHPPGALHRAIRKYGPEVFTVATVAEAYGKQELDALEAKWVQDLKTMAPGGYNLTAGGGSVGKHSAETVAKRAAALRGHLTSPETRRKISETQRGRPLSPEHRAALRVPKRPQSPGDIARRSQNIRETYESMSPERRAKLGGHRKGCKHSPETLEKMRRSAHMRGFSPGEQDRIREVTALMEAARAAEFFRRLVKPSFDAPALIERFGLAPAARAGLAPAARRLILEAPELAFDAGALTRALERSYG